MDEIIKEFNVKKDAYNRALVFNINSIPIMLICISLTLKAKAPIFILIGIIAVIFTISFFRRSALKYKKIEKRVIEEIWNNRKDANEAREKMLELGCRESAVNTFIEIEEYNVMRARLKQTKKHI